MTFRRTYPVKIVTVKSHPTCQHEEYRADFTTEVTCNNKAAYQITSPSQGEIFVCKSHLSRYRAKNFPVHTVEFNIEGEV